MTREEVKDFLKAGVDALTPKTEFGRGLITDFNRLRAHEYPAVWQETAPVGSETNNAMLIDDWSVRLHVAQLDKMDSDPETYEHIVDHCDQVAQELLTQYNLIVSGYKLVVLKGIDREPFIKKHADCLSGVLLTFTLNAPDTTDLCP